MSSLAEIQQAVANLSPEAFTEFEYWFNEERNRRWDHLAAEQESKDDEAGSLLDTPPPNIESPGLL